MIKEFLTYQKEIKGLAIQTLQGYEKELAAFVKYASKRHMSWSKITKQDIDDYTAHMARYGLKPRTIRKRIEVLRLIFTWAQHEGLLDSNPAQFAQTPKAADEIPNVPEMAKIEAYLNKPAKNAEDWLVKAIASFIIETGMRIGELCGMKRTDIDREHGTIKVHGKGNRERTVYYGKRVAAFIAALNLNIATQLFPIDQEQIRWMMYRQMSPEVGRCNPHALRHAFACEQLNKGMDTKTLATLMGHKHEETTEIYARLRLSRIEQIYKQLNILNNGKQA